MKRYIKASYDSSMPSWLKGESGKHLMELLKPKYAMAEAKFYDDPQPNSVVIYLLDDVNSPYHYHDKVAYSSQVNWGWGNYSIEVGNTTRTLNTAAKKRIEEHVIDTVYMVAPLRKEVRPEHYHDPRNAPDWYGKDKYGGQVPDYQSEWDSKKHDWVDRKDLPPRGYYTASGHDKSGYKIPTPTDLYSRLNAKFPDRLKGEVKKVQDQIDAYYDELVAYKQKLFDSIDIRKGRLRSNLPKAMEKLDWAIYVYQQLVQSLDRCVGSDGSIDGDRLAFFMKGGDLKNHTYSLENSLNDIDKLLGQ